MSFSAGNFQPRRRDYVYNIRKTGLGLNTYPGILTIETSGRETLIYSFPTDLENSETACTGSCPPYGVFVGSRLSHWTRGDSIRRLRHDLPISPATMIFFILAVSTSLAVS